MRLNSVYFVVLWCTICVIGSFCVIGCSETPEEDPSESVELPLTAEEMKFFQQAMDIGILVIRREDFGRGVQGEPLWYAPDQEAPYTGWAKNEEELFQIMDGKKHGLYIRWVPYFNYKMEKGSYQNGWRHGSWTFWYENDQKKSEGSYQNGWKAASWIFWYHNGQKKAEGAYRPLDGRIQRPGSLWGPADAEEYRGEPPRTGIWTFWYENGQKAAEGGYRGDKGGQINIKEGVWTFWYENGLKSAEGGYDGDSTVQMLLWWPYLLEREKESFDWYEAPKTFKVGLWSYWYENGQKESQGKYERWDKVGLWSYWYKNGQKESQGKYEKGVKKGSWTYWDVNGQIIRKG